MCVCVCVCVRARVCVQSCYLISFFLHSNILLVTSIFALIFTYILYRTVIQCLIAFAPLFICLCILLYFAQISLFPSFPNVRRSFIFLSIFSLSISFSFLSKPFLSKPLVSLNLYPHPSHYSPSYHRNHTLW